MNKIIMIAILLSTQAASAHSGHHDSNVFGNLIHLLSQPDHAWIILGAITIALISIRGIVKMRTKRSIARAN